MLSADAISVTANFAERGVAEKRHRPHNRRGFAVSGVGREHREGLAVQLGDSAEVPLVERQDSIGRVAIGEYHQRAVRQSKIEVLITVLQLNDPCVFLRVNAGDGEATGSEIRQECAPGGSPEPLPE